MLFVNLVFCGALILCWTRLCVSLIPPYNPTTTGDHPTTTAESGDSLKIKHAAHTSSASTVSHHSPHLPPCFVDDIFAALREGVGESGELTNRSLTLFGTCRESDNTSASVLLELVKRNQGDRLEVLQLSEGLLSEGDENEAFELTFDLPHSHMLERNPVLLLAFKRPFTEENLGITFTSHALHPHTQSVCISGETQYIMLAGKEHMGEVHHKWRVSAVPNAPDMKQQMKDFFIGAKSEGHISMTPLLLFSGERGTDTRYSHLSGTSYFLCEMRRFLGDILPQRHHSHPLQLDSLQSLPPLTLGLSSSETLLAALINSSALTVFSYSSWSSRFRVRPPGELSMSPALLEEVRQRLEQTVEQISAVIREEDVGQRAAERLGRLKELSVFPNKEPAAGESQYCAFLLLKALQTVARALEVEKRLRAARAGDSMGGSVCALRSLTVSLERTLVGPNTANINNCHGSCAFPLVNTNNHAVLLNFHIESGNVEERAPCCVPVAYEHLEVVDLNEHGTYLSIKPDVVAKECSCR